MKSESGANTTMESDLGVGGWLHQGEAVGYKLLTEVENWGEC